MMRFFAQFEREIMKECQVEAIKRVQAGGKYKRLVPKAMQQADKVKALVAAGADRVKIPEQLGISKASYSRRFEGGLAEAHTGPLMARSW